MILPSGIEVTIRRPSFGEIRAARRASQEAGLNGKDAFYVAMWPLVSLTAAEINALDGADGLALEKAIDATLLPRKATEEDPSVPDSSPSS